MKTKSLIELIIFLLYCLCTFTISYSQQFKFSIAFEDAMGNSDTLVIGYDSESTTGIDHAFGEENIISHPWDDTFEARVESIAFQEPEFQTKIQVYPHSCAGECLYYLLTIAIRIDSFPLTISWDKELFTDPCINKSFITDWVPGGWFDAAHGGEQDIKTRLIKTRNSIPPRLPLFPGV